MTIKRQYLPWWEWEEAKTNMWGSVTDRQSYLEKAIEFTGDAEKYGGYMMSVIREWPNSCLHNLSNLTQNRRAWVGHAACALAFDCPEDIVRQAWSFLTEEQQIAANRKADEAIEQWEKWYAKEESGDECARCREWEDCEYLPVI